MDTRNPCNSKKSPDCWINPVSGMPEGPGYDSAKPYTLIVYERELHVRWNYPRENGRSYNRVLCKAGGNVYSKSDSPQHLHNMGYQNDESTERPSPPPVRRSGDIQYFSKKSRARLFSKFQKIQTRTMGKPIFVTLTARAGTLTNEVFQRLFRKRFLPGLKEIIPESAYLWRLEPHRSGRPHYHMVIWSFNKQAKIESQYYGRQLRQLWRDCIGDHSRAAEKYSCRIHPLKSMKEVQGYISKYLAKEDDSRGQMIHGRRWATSSNLPVGSITEVKASPNDLKAIQKLCRAILKGKGDDDRRVNMRLFNDWGFSLWLPETEISKILEETGMDPPRKEYDRYVETGELPAKKGVSVDEICQLFDAVPVAESDEEARARYENRYSDRRQLHIAWKHRIDG